MSIANLKLFFFPYPRKCQYRQFFQEKNFQRYWAFSRQETLYKTTLVINRFYVRLLETTHPVEFFNSLKTKYNLKCFEKRWSDSDKFFLIFFDMCGHFLKVFQLQILKES